MYKLAIPATLLALAGPKSDREIIEYRQLREAQERRNQEIEFICGDVIASMEFSHQEHQADNSTVSCELVFDDGSSAGNVSNRIEAMQNAAMIACYKPEAAAYKSRQPTPKKPMCWVDAKIGDFSSTEALLNASCDCSDFAKSPVNPITTDRWCDRIEAVISDVREEILYNGVVCSCVHAEAVVTDERRDEFNSSFDF